MSAQTVMKPKWSPTWQQETQNEVKIGTIAESSGNSHHKAEQHPAIWKHGKARASCREKLSRSSMVGVGKPLRRWLTVLTSWLPFHSCGSGNRRMSWLVWWKLDTNWSPLGWGNLSWCPMSSLWCIFLISDCCGQDWPIMSTGTTGQVVLGI